MVEIEKMGGKVRVDANSPDKAVIWVDFNVPRTGFQRSDTIARQVTDVGLEHLQKLTQLQG